MTPLSAPLTRDLVLIGGGHTHALLLKRWGMNPLPGTRLTVINPGPTAPYTGMLPGYVAGHYARDDLEIDLVRLARFAGARLILTHATGIDLLARLIHVADRPSIAYDIASIDIGITSAMPDLPGFSDHGVPAKPLGRFADAWSAFLDRGGPARIAIIGAGVGGVELSMAMAHALRARGRDPEITVIEAKTALKGLGGGPRRALLRQLKAMKIALRENTAVLKVGPDAVSLADGDHVPSDLTVGAAGARPWPWLSELGLAHRDGFLEVDRTLRTSDPAIYATGDCAHVVHAPRPKAGVYAVRAAPVLAHNLRADLSGRTRRPFQPQKDFVKLITLGQKSALFEKWGVWIQGPRLWTLKNHIDRAFMDGLANLPPMAPPALPRQVTQGVAAELGGGQPLCAGCGGKVGAATLDAALARLPACDRADVAAGPGDDAALLDVGTRRLAITTDHLRAFSDDPWLFARISAMHALGDIWAMGASPQAALTSVTLPRMSEALQRRTLDEIMDGAAGAFAEAGAAVVGGHTMLGAEMTLGFTVTGLAHDRQIGLGGARPGDALLLTRPIGSGTLFAGEMSHRADGAAVAAMLEELARPQAEAARLLGDAHAMTDVTGFGLAGHLMKILEASDYAAEIEIDAIPLFDGALELSEAGVRATLYPANRSLTGPAAIPETARAALLFDPQTAGGLLACVDAGEADSLVGRLIASGFRAARIGTIVAGPARLTVRG